MYLHIAIITRYGPASLNHGQKQGNLSLLQKAQLGEAEHSFVSGSCIRRGLRDSLQEQGYTTNQKIDPTTGSVTYESESCDGKTYTDIDLFGNAVLQSHLRRLGPTQVTPGISLKPYTNETAFCTRSVQNRDSNSLFHIEFHTTRYGYCVTVKVDDLIIPSRIFGLINAVMNIGRVGGHGNVFSYDFSPESFICRWTKTPQPMIQYAFDVEDSSQKTVVIKEQIMEEIISEEIPSQELWISGPVARGLSLGKAHIDCHRKNTIQQLKERISQDLDIPLPPPIS